MRKIIHLLFAFGMVFNLFAQAPNKMSYQAILRNSNNQLLVNSSIGMRISILKGSSNGPLIFSEIFNPNPMTNSNGLVSLEIGSGIAIIGSFASIDWSNGPYYIKTETDPMGTTNYTLIATQELLSVPYAMYAANSANYSAGQGIRIQNNAISLDQQNAQDGQILKWNGAAWSPGTDNTGTNYTAGQGIDISNNSVSLSKQNALTGQVLKWNGMAWTPAVDSNSANLWILNGNNVFRNTGFVGIGNNNPSYPLDVRLSRKNGILRVMDETIDTSYRSPVNFSYHSSANSGVGLVSSGGKNPFKNLDSLTVNLKTSHIGILAGGDDFGIAGSGNTGVVGTGIDGGRFFGKEYGLICDSKEYGLLIFNKKDELGIVTIRGKAEFYNDVAVSSRNPDVVFPVANYSETTDNAGYFILWGPQGNPNIVATTLAGNPEHGYLTLFNGTSAEAGMYLDNNNRGVIFGDIKSFRMKHPEKPGKEIWYASLEGPEAAAYIRGTGELINGEATIQFTEDFQLVSNSKTMTVNLTPISADSKGLALVEKTNTGFRVKELFSGTGNYAFDWEVKCVRKGYEDFKVVRDEKELETKIPIREKTFSSDLSKYKSRLPLNREK
ncbi:MAG: hypothetical protein ABIO44_02945 [Saprospiraceae bacterium]